MSKYFLTIITTGIIFTTTAQNNMQPISQLINKTDPGWPLVKKWITTAKNKVEVLPVDTAKAKNALYKTQVTTRSPMGAIVRRRKYSFDDVGISFQSPHPSSRLFGFFWLSPNNR
jgi:Protein of unknown function DUF2625